MADEALFESACENALRMFNLTEFREVQLKSLKEIVTGNDVFVNLPTGSGK